MRGKHSSSRASGRPEGITPAHAGKTELRRPRDFDGRDHPRACGENYQTIVFPPSWRGSPPRMRGKQSRKSRGRHSPGITPAHAGKTVNDSEQGSHAQDHPRACGENAKENKT